jgi:hypothetical protein
MPGLIGFNVCCVLAARRPNGVEWQRVLSCDRNVMHAEKLRCDAYRLTDSKLSSRKRKRAAEHTPLPALNLQKLQQAPFLKHNLTISKHLGRGVTGDPVSWTLPYTPGRPASCGRERLTIIIIAPISPLSLSLWCLSWPFSSSLLLFLLLFNHSLLAGPAPGFSLQRSFCLTPDLAGLVLDSH